jgi:transposase
MIRYAGLDIHKRVVEACVLDEAGQVLLRQRWPLTPESLVAFAQEHLGPDARVVVEATTNTWAVVAVLKPHVGEAVVSNPLATKAIAQAKVKTDKVDAYVLAQLLRSDFLPRVWEPDPATQELRRLTSYRTSLVADRTGIKNRLHALLAQRLILPPCELFSKKGLAWLRVRVLDEEGRLLVDSDLRLLAAVEAEIARLEQRLARKGQADGRVKLLMTLPGVDRTVAQTVLAALGDLSRFRDGAHAASYLGLVPSTKQSAEHCYHGPITKHGNGHARWVLVQAAQHLGKNPGPLGVFFRRLARKKNYNAAVVACARKLVVIAWHMLHENQPYRYAQPQATQTKLARLRIQAGGRKRKSGPKRQTTASPRGSGRTRLVKSLAEIYREEELPAMRPAPAGEARTIRENGIEAYVVSLQTARRVPRPSKPGQQTCALPEEQATSGIRAGISRHPADDQGAHCRPLDPASLSLLPEQTWEHPMADTGAESDSAQAAIAQLGSAADQRFS